MKIAFLGTACAEPTAENGFTSFLLETSEALLLIDASGNPVQSVLRAGRDPLDIDVVVLTHSHADHVAGYPSLLQTSGCLGRERPITVVCSEATRERTIKLSEALDIRRESIGFEAEFRDSFDEGALSIVLTDGRHSVPSSMVLIQEGEVRLFYTSDTSYNPEVGSAARECRLLIHEATFSHSLLGTTGTKGHSSAYQAGLNAAAARVQTLFLCHYCARKHSGEATIVEEARRAFDGEVVLPRAFEWYTL